MARDTPKNGTRKRGKYGRPCDNCSARRVRCVTRPEASRCTCCEAQNVECTFIRVRKKLGPKVSNRLYAHAENAGAMPALSLLNQLSLFADAPLRLSPRYIPLNVRDPSEDTPQFANRFTINPQTSPALAYLAQLPLVSYPMGMTFDAGSFEQRDTWDPPARSARGGLSPRPIPIGASPPLPSGLVTDTQLPEMPGASGIPGTGIPETSVPGAGFPRDTNRIPAEAPMEPQLAAPLIRTTEPPPQYAAIPIDKLLPCLQVYQTWFYGYWPVLSVADLMLTLVGNSDMDDLCSYFALTERNAMSYALCCAVCATILTQMTFVLSKIKYLSVNKYLPPEDYARDAKRVRHMFDYTCSPNVVTLLTSFFLYTHYVNIKGKTKQAIMYLREAITMSQLLGLHDPSTYVNKSAAEVHRCKKIYYMLLVTERFMCFEDGLPLILDPIIEIPSLKDEEYPGLLVGFTELVRVFAVPSKGFFGELHQKLGNLDLGAFSHTLDNKPIGDGKKWVLDVHRKLNQPLSNAIQVSDAQKLNIVLSRAWIRAMAWNISAENGFISQSADTLNCLSICYPLNIVNDFLLATENLPLFAFESNGPGICVKLLEIGSSLNRMILHHRGNMLMGDRLHTIFSIVTRYRNDVSLPMDVYDSIAATLVEMKNTVPHPITSAGYENAKIEEIFDSENKQELLFRDSQLDTLESQTESSIQLLHLYKDATQTPPADPFSGIALSPIMHTSGDTDALSKSKSNSALSIIDLMHAFAQDQAAQNKGGGASPHISPGFLS